MSDYFTTEELADFLRIKSRKVYDLVSKDSVPHSRVMGKLLFSKVEISNWISGKKSRVIENISENQVDISKHNLRFDINDGKYSYPVGLENIIGKVK